MGNLFGKKKQSRVTEQDKAVLGTIQEEARAGDARRLKNRGPTSTSPSSSWRTPLPLENPPPPGEPPSLWRTLLPLENPPPSGEPSIRRSLSSAARLQA
ncbi:Charged multivesicular body protein 6 [Liparis tanakae]|uniref:Charged multivesicular body protein 6 n=1 Tax=Liparis tanakae TaxID=230148 RepID=A0A4Z2EYN4_9TELE|nr:Charged multivesicular body protein 6 [Liparis tanakae]